MPPSRALLFADNSTDNVNFGAGASFGPLNIGSVIWWGYWPSVANVVRGIFNKEVAGASDDITCFRRAADGTVIRLQLTTSATTLLADTTTGTVVANTWLCMLARWNVGVAASWMRGTESEPLLDRSSAPTLGSGTHNSGAQSFRIGAVSGCDAMRVGPFAVFPRWLSDNEARAWQRRSIPRPGNVLFVLPGATDASTIQRDLSGCGNHGTITGATLTEGPRMVRVKPYRRRDIVFMPPTLFTVTVAGTLATAGALSKEPRKVLAGVLSTAGAVSREPRRVLAGTLTTAGALTAIKTVLKDLGTNTLTTAGALARQTGKVLVGTQATTGVLTKQAQKPLGGTVTTAGALAAIKTALISLAGTLTTAGALQRQPGKALGGTVSTAGGLVREVRRTLAGTLSSAGTLTRSTQKSMGGTLTAAGALASEILGHLVNLIRMVISGSGQPTYGTATNVVLTVPTASNVSISFATATSVAIQV
jgi:hypothetical protein